MSEPESPYSHCNLVRLVFSDFDFYDSIGQKVRIEKYGPVSLWSDDSIGQKVRIFQYGPVSL